MRLCKGMFVFCPIFFSGTRSLEHLGCLDSRMHIVFTFILEFSDASDKKPSLNKLLFLGG